MPHALPARRRWFLLALGLLTLALTAYSAAGRPVNAGNAPPSIPAQVASAQEAPPLGQDMITLQSNMAWVIQNYWVPGQYSVAVTDLQTGETVSVNGDQPQLSGCVINLFALFEVARDLWFARYSQADVEALVAETIWSSNAHTARELYGRIGGGNVVEGVRDVNRLIHDVLHLDGVVLDHPPAYGDSIGISPDNWVTASAMNRALSALWHSEFLDPSWRDFLLYHMTNVKPGLQYLTAAVPEGLVSHKNGFMPTYYGYVDNDVGIVRLNRGGVEYAYAISFFSQGVAEEYADIPLAQQLGQLAYQVMANRYP
jgi:hypothetical protein